MQAPGGVEEWDHYRGAVRDSNLSLLFGAGACDPIRFGCLSERQERGYDSTGAAPETSFRPRFGGSAVADQDGGDIRQRAGDVSPHGGAWTSPLNQHRYVFGDAHAVSVGGFIGERRLPDRAGGPAT